MYTDAVFYSPGWKSALEGHRAGDVLRVRPLPEHAAGKREVDLLHEVPLAELPPGESIREGSHLMGTGPDGNDTTFRITRIQDGIVYLDGNDPLAGQTLLFEIEIQGIRDATAEEIECKTVKKN